MKNSVDKPARYLIISDRLHDTVWFCSEVRVEGLETLDYFDYLLERERCTEQADAITFDGEVMLTFCIPAFVLVSTVANFSLTYKWKVWIQNLCCKMIVMGF